MLCGIFVGGQARRMGGRPKGLLPAPDGSDSLVGRLARLASALGHEPVLVGDAAPYRSALPQLRVLADQPPGVGPLGGLAALLAASDAEVLALSCDLPFVSSALIARLADTDSAADVLSPRGESGLWEPLCARYRPASVRPALAQALAAGERSFQRLFVRLRVEELGLTEGERGQLVDWDSPEDLTR